MLSRTVALGACMIGIRDFPKIPFRLSSLGDADSVISAIVGARSIRLATDMVDSYRQKIKDGTPRELAYQEIRTTIDAVKDRANRRLYDSVPRYSVIIGGSLNIKATWEATEQAALAGKLSEHEAEIEFERLTGLQELKLNKTEKNNNGE